MKKVFITILFICFSIPGIHRTMALQTGEIHIQPRTLQRETDLKQVSIVVPQDNEWKKVGERLQKLLETKYNSKVELKIVDTTFPGLWSGNTILIGNLGNNRYFSRLYAMRYTFADAYYPGSGGYQLQTLINPFGKQGNTIIVGASDLAGLEKGVRRIEDILGTSSAAQLPWLNEAVLAEEVREVLSTSFNLDDLLDKLSPEDGNYQTTLTVFGRLGSVAENYHLTGMAEAGETYKKAMLAFSDFINAHPEEGMNHLNKRENIWTNGAAFYAGWYVSEPSALFSADERKRIVSAVYTVLKANSRDRYLRSAPKQAPRNNHETYPAMSLLCGSIYFLDHYSHLDYYVRPWYTTAEQMFANNTALISRDDGSDYMMHVPQATLDYSLITGDQRFLDYGLRASADLQATLLDNLGVMAGGGDGYPFGRSSAYHWGHSKIMHAASWYYADPKYQYLLERVKNGPFPNQMMGDLNRPLRYYKTDISGRLSSDWKNQPLVQGNVIDAGVYGAIGDYDKTEINVAQKDTFHKLGFRRGFGVNDAYLLIDGNAAGRAHNHHDANTILRYSEHGRIFLETREYIERGPEHKTGVIIVKDGVQESKPVLAKVNWVGDLQGIALSQTELQQYNGADWQRTIISPGGRFFLILDNILVRKSGSYMLENVWQSLGNLSIKKDRFEVVQEGVTMTLQSLDESELRSNDRYHHFKQYYRRNVPYPYADTENVLREVKTEAAYKVGDSFCFANVLSSSTDEKTIVEAERIGQGTYKLTEKEDEWWVVWNPQARNPDFQTDGQFLLFNEQILVVAGLKRLSYGSLKLNFKEPVLLYLDIGEKQWTAYSAKAGMLHYDKSGMPMTDHVVLSGKHGLGSQDIQQFRTAWAATSEMPQKSDRPPVVPDVPDGWEKIGHWTETVVSSAIGDLDGDGNSELILGSVSGKVQALGYDGKTLWNYESGSRVNELTVTKYEDKTVVTIANENWMAHVLDSEGKRIWQKEFKTARVPSQGSLIGITNIRVAHIEGKDRAPWFMVGSSFNHLFGVDISGKELYNKEAYFYGIMDMQFADYTGRGQDIGVLGMEYVNPALFPGPYKPLERVQRIGNGPGWKVVRTFPDKRMPGIVLGTKEHIVHYTTYENGTIKELWAQNVGGEVNDIFIDRQASSEILVGSSGHQVYALTKNGSVKWRSSVGDRVLKVRSIRRNGAFYGLAGLDNGQLIFIRSDGTIDQRVRFSSNIENILVCDVTNKVWVVLNDGRVLSPIGQ